MSCAAGIRLVEKYLSRVLGKEYVLYLIRESRFFPVFGLSDEGLILDLSVCEEPDSHRVIAEISTGRNVWMEINGMAAAADSAG